ncbi:MAG: ATP-grasp domain-containing protein [Alphaproteobacteria bacterium]|nr:ATP-grasp domain-containing protein [Alphaproteobacteria bacterium]
MTLNRPFKSVLIANRGEIAVRIVREAQAAGLRAIAVYSDADKRALHVESADAAVHIGPAPARDSYLNAEHILAAAKQTNAEAIHPGYGFLSENPDFAQAVIDAGLVWIGPSPAAIRAMGDKGNAKEIARKAGVPVIPGYDGDDQSGAKLLAEAKKIGWPVLIKAALGGGGRGQRRVTQEADFADALASARREALSAFASDRMILEKALDNVRHIEVQVFGDAHGNVIHLGERDCSVQRRNQKIIEEAPAPGVSEELRQRMGTAAVALAKAVNYTNAGTVEYLLDREGHFYFLEMNTRIQVEHPVTEEVTGTNLIQWQFTVAKGEPLPLKQNDVKITGHAIEVRLCAEDPGDAFRPQLGRIAGFATSRLKCRVDIGVSRETEITDNYDSMIAKIIANGSTRDDARRKLLDDLMKLYLVGPRTNRSYLIDLLSRDAVVAGAVDIGWLERQPTFADDHLLSDTGATAALFLAYGRGNGWTSTGVRRTKVKLRERDKEHEYTVENGRVGNVALHEVLRAYRTTPSTIVVDTPKGRIQADIDKRGASLQLGLHEGRNTAHFEDITYAPAEPKGSAGANVIRAPMAGRIVKLMAEPGQTVAKNQVLVILEAMKMEHELKALTDGVVESIAAKVGDQVAMRQTLVTLKQ